VRSICFFGKSVSQWSPKAWKKLTSLVRLACYFIGLHALSRENPSLKTVRKNDPCRIRGRREAAILWYKFVAHPNTNERSRISLLCLGCDIQNRGGISVSRASSLPSAALFEASRCTRAPLASFSSRERKFCGESQELLREECLNGYECQHHE
jgi:hypothetical protein